MTAIIKEEKTMDMPAKTYLKVYEDHINGYKQYKMERTAPAAKPEKKEPAEK